MTTHLTRVARDLADALGVLLCWVVLCACGWLVDHYIDPRDPA